MSEARKQAPSNEDVCPGAASVLAAGGTGGGSKAGPAARGAARRGACGLPHRERRAGGGRRPLSASRRFALDGRGEGRVHPVPLPRLGVGRERRRLHASPLLGRSGPDSARSEGLSVPSARAVGPRLDVLGGAGERDPRRFLVRSSGVAMVPRSAFRAAGGARADDRELPRRRPLRLRPQGHPWRRRRGGRAAQAGPQRAGGDTAMHDGSRRGGGADMGLGARYPLPGDRPELHLDADGRDRRGTRDPALRSGNQRD